MAVSPASGASDASGAFPEGVPCWVDAQLPDVEAGKRFYGELFGWTFAEGYGPSGLAHLHGEPLAALTPQRDGRMPTVWTVYFPTPAVTPLPRPITEAGGAGVS